MSLSVDIKKKLGSFTLDVVFEAGNEIMAVLGASGCGKSMTLKCIAGVETPDEGKIVLDGRILFDSEKKINLSAKKRKIGYLFQNYALFPNMTVEQNIGAGVRLDKSIKNRKEEKKRIVNEKIAAFYLQGLEHKYPSQLSGGQQQRVALARILASDPEILMLDEPFSALDSYLKWQLEQEMMEVLEQYPGTTLFVSHNRDEVYRMCDKVVVLSDGKVEAISSKQDLFLHPKTLAATLLTGCKNISHAKKISDHTLKALDWDIELYTEEIVPDGVQYIGVRAHYFKVASSKNTPNTMECNIKRVIDDTFSTIIMFNNQNGSCNTDYSNIRWEVDKDTWAKLQKQGGPLYLSIAPKDILMMQ